MAPDLGTLMGARRDEILRLQLSVRRALLLADSAKRRQVIASPAGDEERLRGIPVLAKGVGGTMRGTKPGERIRE